MKRCDVVWGVDLKWTTVEVWDLGEKTTASHPLLSGSLGIPAGLEPAVLERGLNVRWAEPGRGMPL